MMTFDISFRFFNIGLDRKRCFTIEKNERGRNWHRIYGYN